jgi:hypothetical protein
VEGAAMFARAFMATGYAKTFWQHSRKGGAIDGAHRRAYFSGQHLLFTTIDANRETTLLAWAVVDWETKGTLHFFFFFCFLIFQYVRELGLVPQSSLSGVPWDKIPGK